MENASKALLIAGAILLCILIIAIGMFIYNSAQSTITDSLTSLSTQEIEAFNNQFITYQGIQKGTNVKMLLRKLIANVNIYANEPAKVPLFRLYYQHSGTGYLNGAYAVGKERMYITRLENVMKRIKVNHEYYVYITYQKNGLIDVIEINYSTPTDITKHEGWNPRNK